MAENVYYKIELVFSTSEIKILDYLSKIIVESNIIIEIISDF